MNNNFVADSFRQDACWQRHTQHSFSVLKWCVEYASNHIWKALMLMMITHCTKRLSRQYSRDRSIFSKHIWRRCVDDGDAERVFALRLQSNADKRGNGKIHMRTTAFWRRVPNRGTQCGHGRYSNVFCVRQVSVGNWTSSKIQRLLHACVFVVYRWHICRLIFVFEDFPDSISLQTGTVHEENRTLFRVYSNANS